MQHPEKYYYNLLLGILLFTTANVYPVFIVYTSLSPAPTVLDWLIPNATYLLSWLLLVFNGYMAYKVKPSLFTGILSGVVTGFLGTYLSYLFLIVFNQSPLVDGRIIWDGSGLDNSFIIRTVLETIGTGAFFGLIGGYLALRFSKTNKRRRS